MHSLGSQFSSLVHVFACSIFDANDGNLNRKEDGRLSRVIFSFKMAENTKYYCFFIFV